MKFIYYIAASVVSHLLIIGFLYLTPPFKEAAPSVFKVDIVTPPVSSKLPQTKQPEPAVRKTRPPLVKHRPDPPEKELPPQTLFGKGPGVNIKDTGKGPNNTKSSGNAERPASPEGDDKSPATEKGPKPPEGNGAGIAPRASLFDKKTIEKYARTAPPAQKGLTFDTSEFRHRGYMRMLRERIESIWQYPKEAARLGLSGELYLKFSIKKDGRLEEVELMRTSGFKDLDEAAIKAVKNAGPFWPLPEDWDKDTLEIKGHFIYIFGDTMVF